MEEEGQGLGELIRASFSHGTIGDHTKIHIMLHSHIRVKRCKAIMPAHTARGKTKTVCCCEYPLTRKIR
jgi:hypothetical protein